MDVSNGGLSFTATADFSQVSKEANKILAALGKVNTTTEKLSNSLEQWGDINRESLKYQAAAIKELEKTYNELGDRIASLPEPRTDKQREQQEQLRKSYYELGEELDAEREKYELMKEAVDINEFSEKRLQIQLRAVQGEMTKLKAAGLEDSEQYKQLAEQAEKLEISINSVTDELKPQSSALMALSGGISTATGSMSALLGVYTLFGGQAEKNNEIMRKMQSLMSITIGLQTVSTQLSKTSALMRGIERVQTSALNKAQAISNTAKEKDIALTGRQIVVQKILNAVAKANPYVLLAAAIMSVVGAIVLFNREGKRLENELKDIEKAANNAESSIAEMRFQFDRWKMRAEASGFNSEFVREKEIEEAEKELEEFQKVATKAAEAVNKARHAYYDEPFWNSISKEELDKAEEEYKKTADRLHEYRMNLRRKQAEDEAASIREAKENVNKEIELRRKAEDEKFRLIKDGFTRQREETKANYKRQIQDINRELAENQNLTDPMKAKLKERVGTLESLMNDELKKISNQEAIQRRKSLETINAIRQEELRNEEDFRNEMAQMTIDLMNDGFDKEMAQETLNHEKRMKELERQLEEEKRKIAENALTEYLNLSENIGKDKDELTAKFYRDNFNKTTGEFVPAAKEINDRLESVTKQFLDKMSGEMSAFAKLTRDKIAEIVGSVDTYETEIARLEADTQRRREEIERALYAKDDNGNLLIQDAKTRNALEKEWNELSDKQAQSANEITLKYGHLADLENRLKRIETERKALYDSVVGNVERMTDGQRELFDSLTSQAKAIKDAIDAYNEGLEETTEKTEQLDNNVRDIASVISNVNGSAWGSVLSQIQGAFQKGRDKIEEKRAEALKGKTDKDEIERINATYDKQQAKLNATLGAIQVVMAGISEMASAFKQLGEAGDDSMKQTGEALEGIASAASTIIQGAASGGWIGAVIAAVMVIAEETIKIIAMQKRMEAAVREGIHMKWMEDIDKELAESDTVFGENYRKKIDNAIDVMRQSKDKFEAMYKELAGQEINEDEDDMYGDPIGWLTHKLTGFNWNFPVSGLLSAIIPNKVFEKYKEAIAKGYDDIEAYMVKRQDRSGFANFLGIQDDYESLKDMIEGLGYEMYDQYGNLNAEALQVILDTYEDLGEEDRKWMEEAIDYSNQYKEAMQQLDEYISDVFGNTASTIADQFIDSFLASGKAAMDFGAVVGDVSRQMVKDLIQSMILDDVFNEDMQNKFRDILKDSSLDQNAKTMALMSLFTDAQGQIEAMTPAIQALLESYSGFFDDAGQALQQGNDFLGSVTQESVDLLNGQLNAIRYHQLQVQGRLDDVLASMAGIHTSIDDGFSKSADLLERIDNNTRTSGSMHSTGTMTVS
jgi:hypothetical protein